MFVPRAAFSLDAGFVSEYRDRQPEWGPLGYPVYKRTYALVKPDGTTEEFWETCQRVVEGVYQIQKGHCQRYNMPWNDRKAQRSAQEMYRRMFQFKWLPPGRGLYKMGTQAMFKLGSAVLQNCAVRSTADIGNPDIHNAFSAPFTWLMDHSMLGVGVGVTCEGVGKVRLVNPAINAGETFVVPDTREGWCDALERCLEAYVKPGLGLPRKWDYSKVRPYGSPIRGFGGTASGPEALQVLLEERIPNRLMARDGELITSRDIVDLATSVGECVVAGGARRSAILMAGNADDSSYLHLKDYSMPETAEWPRWASNNSVIVLDNTDITEAATLTGENGEPGFLFIENARKYGRMIDPANYKDMDVISTNPCLRGDTLIAVADGRGAVSIETLAAEGNDVPVYSMDTAGNVTVQWGRDPRKTAANAEIIRIHLDSGKHIDVTPNHKMTLRTGEFVEARDLKEGDSLTVIRKWKDTIKKGGKEYWRIHTNVHGTGKGNLCSALEHRLLAKFAQSEKYESLYNEAKKSGWVKGGIVIHHKDHDGLNNRFDNLEIMTFKDHTQSHIAVDCAGEKNGMWGKEHTEYTKQLIGSKARDRFKDPEYAKRHKEGFTPEGRRAIADSAREARKRDWLSKYEYLMETSGLATELRNGRLWVKKECEVCKAPFDVLWSRRVRAHCSNICAGNSAAVVAGRTALVLSRQQKRLHDQIMVFKDLQNLLGRDPTSKEWEAECSVRGVKHRLRRGTEARKTVTNPSALFSYEDLKTRAQEYNHRVTRIEHLTERVDVYNITVDNNHTYFISLPREDGNVHDLVSTRNCGEIFLQNAGYCTLIETFPHKHDSYEDYERTLKFAYLYGKTVTLVPSHDAMASQVLMRTRRIGLSQSGIQDAIAKIGVKEHLRWCDAGYKYVQKLDDIYSNWLCIPRSIKTTTVKPSGTISKMVGCREGIHHEKGEYILQAIRFPEVSPMIQEFQRAGYRVEDSVNEARTKVVYFPVHSPGQRPIEDITMWEQLELTALMQAYWADNAVSVTVDFDKEKEGKLIGLALEMYRHRLKSVSFLPREDHGYAQAPKTVITKEEYEAYKAQLKPLDFRNLQTHDTEDRFCNNGVCEVPQKEN